jgi:protein TonB
MYAEPEQQHRISPSSRKFLIALLFSTVSHAVAITLVDHSAVPTTPALAPLRIVLGSAPPIVTPPAAAGPEQTEPTPEPTPEPAIKSEPPPEPTVKPDGVPEPAPPPPERKVAQTRHPRPKRPAPSSPVEPQPATEPTTVVAALSATAPTASAAAIISTESRKVEYLYNPPPAYPPRARRLGLEGEVLIRTRVLPNGETDRLVLERSSGYALLDDAAMEAVRKWRFRPARRGDEQIVSWIEIPVRFRLER